MINKKIESENKFFYIYYRFQEIMLDNNVVRLMLN